MKKKGTLILLASAVLLILALLYAQYKRNTIIDIFPQGEGTFVDPKGVYTLTTRYEGNSQWNYEVTAELPNPCYSALVEARVAESAPEQVTIQVVPQLPGADQFCVQTINNFRFSGTFSASDRAKVSLTVMDEPAK